MRQLVLETHTNVGAITPHADSATPVKVIILSTDFPPSRATVHVTSRNLPRKCLDRRPCVFGLARFDNCHSAELLGNPVHGLEVSRGDLHCDRPSAQTGLYSEDAVSLLAIIDHLIRRNSGNEVRDFEAYVITMYVSPHIQRTRVNRVRLAGIRQIPISGKGISRRCQRDKRKKLLFRVPYVPPICDVALLGQARKVDSLDTRGDSDKCRGNNLAMRLAVSVIVRQDDDMFPFQVPGVFWPPFLGAECVRRCDELPVPECVDVLLALHDVNGFCQQDFRKVVWQHGGFGRFPPDPSTFRPWSSNPEVFLAVAEPAPLHDEGEFPCFIRIRVLCLNTGAMGLAIIAGRPAYET